MMKIFIDCEFNDFQGELISMALVSEDGKSFLLKTLLVKKEDLMTTLVKCNSEEEFNALILHIFFKENRAKLYQEEITIHDYESIQECLGIVEPEDGEIDLLDEFLSGNHKYSKQKYPVYVEWDFFKFGCESYAQERSFQVHPEKDFSFPTFMKTINKAEEEKQKFLNMLEKLNQGISDN